MNRFIALALVPLALALTCKVAFASDTSVGVRLQDASTGQDIKGMQIVADKASVPAGGVHFKVTNASRSLVHEMIVVRTDAPISSWAYDTEKDKADEAKLKSLGEVSELKPGRSGTLRLVLKPGSYRLFCNQPGHLHGAMWTSLEVLPTHAAMLR